MGDLLFLSGTDTGVGKTYVGTLLLRELLARGVNAFAVKPVESGCENSPEGGLIPADGMEYYKILKDSARTVEDVCYYRYREQVSPNIAARLSGTTPEPEKIGMRILGEGRKRDVVLVEGAGGILVEVTDGYSCLDLVRDFGMRVILVAPNRLGVLNQVALNAIHLENSGVGVAGIVLNEPVVPRGEASLYNVGELRRIYGDSLVGHIPYNSTVLPDGMIETLIGRRDHNG